MSLITEITKQIFLSIGYKQLFADEFKSEKKFSIQYEDEQIVSYPIWSVKQSVQDGNLNIICTQIDGEMFLIMQLDSSPMFGFFYSEQSSMKMSQGKVWSTPSVYLQANFLAGIELMTSLGLSFQSSPPLPHMIDALITLIEVE